MVTSLEEWCEKTYGNEYYWESNKVYYKYLPDSKDYGLDVDYNKIYTLDTGTVVLPNGDTSYGISTSDEYKFFITNKLDLKEGGKLL